MWPHRDARVSAGRPRSWGGSDIGAGGAPSKVVSHMSGILAGMVEAGLNGPVGQSASSWPLQHGGLSRWVDF